MIIIIIILRVLNANIGTTNETIGDSVSPLALGGRT